MCDFITIPRGIFRDESLDDIKYSRREAYLYLIQKAVYQSQTVPVKGGRVELKRGQLCASIRYLADAWGWSKDKVSRTLSDFVAERRIDIFKDGITSIISIVNYDLYQPLSDVGKDTDKDGNKDADKDKYNKDNNNNKENKEKKSSNEDKEKILASVNRIYSLYPTKCPVSGRPTGKSSKDKVKIEILLRKRAEEEIASIIERYLSESTSHQSYIKNFSTFLNNIPDYTENVIGEPPKPDGPVFSDPGAYIGEDGRIHSNTTFKTFAEFEMARIKSEKELAEWKKQNGKQ